MSASAGPRLATRLLLVARQPDSGRLPRGASVPVMLRAALLGELVVSGRLAADPSLAAPALRGPGPTAPDRVLDAVRAAVERRPGVPWRRWFTHVQADRRVLVGELVDSGRWTASGVGRFVDTDPDATEAERRLFTALSVRAQRPADPLEGFGGCLAQLLGPRSSRPSPDTIRREWTPVLTGTTDQASEVAAGEVAATLVAIASAAAAGRRRRRAQRASLFSLRRG